MHSTDVTRSALDRLGLLTGAAWVVCILVGNSLTESGVPEGDGPADALTYFALLRGGSHQVGLALELLGFCLMAVFVARLYAALRNAEGPSSWLPGVALAGGLTTLAIKLGSAAFLVVGLTVKDLPGEQAALMLQLGDAAFLVSAMTSGVLTLGVAGSALVSGLLPRLLAGLGLPLGALAVLGSLAPSSLDGTPGVLGFLLGLLWLGAISVLLAVRGERTAGSHDRVLAPA